MFCTSRKCSDLDSELAYNSKGGSSLSTPRKHYTAVEKVAILRRHVVERVPLCGVGMMINRRLRPDPPIRKELL